MPYIGRTLGQGTRSRFLYTATAGQTTFSGSDSQSNTLAYADNNGLDCFQNGVLLKGGGADYTATSGTSVVLTTGASVNDVIEILVYDVFAIADHVKKSGDAMTGALTNIDVNGTELILDADGDTSIGATTDDTLILKTNSNTALSIDANGHITKPLQSAFFVKPSADQNNVSTGTTIVFDTERFDQNGDFASNTFTAPITGKYNLNFSVRIDNLDSDATFNRVILRMSNLDITSQIMDLRGLSGDPLYWNFSASVFVDMDANDTAYLDFTQYQGTTQADVKSASHFSGFLAC